MVLPVHVVVKVCTGNTRSIYTCHLYEYTELFLLSKIPFVYSLMLMIKGVMKVCCISVMIIIIIMIIIFTNSGQVVNGDR